MPSFWCPPFTTEKLPAGAYEPADYELLKYYIELVKVSGELIYRPPIFSTQAHCKSACFADSSVSLRGSAPLFTAAYVLPDDLPVHSARAIVVPTNTTTFPGQVATNSSAQHKSDPYTRKNAVLRSRKRHSLYFNARTLLRG
jgi:hypothetical protein